MTFWYILEKVLVQFRYFAIISANINLHLIDGLVRFVYWKYFSFIATDPLLENKRGTFITTFKCHLFTTLFFVSLLSILDKFPIYSKFLLPWRWSDITHVLWIVIYWSYSTNYVDLLNDSLTQYITTSWIKFSCKKYNVLIIYPILYKVCVPICVKSWFPLFYRHWMTKML